MLDELAIKRVLESLNKKRDEVIAEANKNLAYLNGQIQALEAVLDPEPEPGSEKVEEPKG